METPTLKARGAAIPLPLEAPANRPRPVAAEPAASRRPARIYRSLCLRPDEWHDIVAKGRRG